MSYFSETEAVLYYMHCSLSHSAALTDREFYSEHSCLVQECCEINSVCSYLNDHHTLCLVKSSMLLDSCTFQLSDFQQFSFRSFYLSLLFSSARQHFEC